MMLTEAELENMKKAALVKKEILENIYDITSRRTFRGEQSEAQEFIDYLDLREPYVQELTDFSKGEGQCLKDFQIDFSNSNGVYRDVSQIIANNEDIKNRILEMDKRNNKNMQKVLDFFSGEVSKYNKTKKARQSYGFFQAQGDTESPRTY